MPLTRAHVLEWHGEEGKFATVKGVAAFSGDKLVGIGGLQKNGNRWFAFVNLKDEIRAHKVFLHRTTKRYLDSQKQRHARIYTLQDTTETTAARWLSVLGFEEMGMGVWQWQE